MQVYEDQNKKVLKGFRNFFFIAKGYRVVCDTNEQKRGEVEMEKKERNIGVSGGWGGSVVGVERSRTVVPCL